MSTDSGVFEQRKHMSKFTYTYEEKMERGVRGRSKRATEYAYLIEGESLNMTQIAERLGVARRTATLRHRACSVPVTWEKLQCPAP